MCGKTVLYITFIDFNVTAQTGSSVRPIRMYNAFVENGYNVKVVSGAGNNRKIRNSAVHNIREWLKDNKPDFCYIEPPSGPLFFFSDRKLIMALKKMKVPTAFFYRDIYWKFPTKDFENKATDLLSMLKSGIIKGMQFRDYLLIKKCVNQVYFPTMKCNEFLEFVNAKTLPPGCDLHDVKLKKTRPNTAIFVGGATERYGIRLLIESAKKVSSVIDFRLIIVCPEKQWKEWLAINSEYSVLPSYIEMYHIGDGEKMEELYARADVGLIPIMKTKYNNLSLPIKLFEYISHLLPIVSTSCDSIVDFLKPFEISILTEDNVDKFADGIIRFFQENHFLEKAKRNIIDVREKNLWIKRVEQIDNDLS